MRLVYVACILPTASLACADSPAVQAKVSATNSAIEQLVAQHYSGGWGVELAIYHNGRALYVHGFGLRDRGLPDSFGGEDFWGIEQPDVQFHLSRASTAPDSNTIFDLASMSKEFTAGAILLLQQDGKLSVTDRVSKYLPAFPHGDQMSLLDLLRHSSGLVDYNNFGEYPDFSAAYNAFKASGGTDYHVIVDRLATFPLLFAPGTQYKYSNSNYLLLAVIVAQVSGEPFSVFLQSRIFGPLGMTHTHQGLTAPVTDLALGYADYGKGAQRAWQPNLAWLAGPGGLTSTVGDIERWDRAVRQPGIFTPTSLTQMFTPGPFPLPYGTYADGWFVSSLNGHVYHWHDGDVGGYQTMNGSFPNDGIDIVILTNDGSGLDPYYIVPQLFPIALSMAGAH